MIRALVNLILLPFRLVFGLAHGVIGLIFGLLSLIWGLISGAVSLVIVGVIIAALARFFGRRRAW